MFGGTNMGRDADTIAVMAGPWRVPGRPLAGALHGRDAVPGRGAGASTSYRPLPLHHRDRRMDLTGPARDLQVTPTAQENAV